MSKDRQKKNIVFYVLWICIVVWGVFLVVSFMVKTGENKKLDKQFDTLKTRREVILAVDKENGTLTTMNVDKKDEANTISYSVPFSDEGDIGFKPGQEIKIYHIGFVPRNSSNFGNTVKKIEILKQNSSGKVSEASLRAFNYSIDNVYVEISSLTKNGITYRIVDNNWLPYDYSNGLAYKLLKKTKCDENNEYYKENKIADVKYSDTIIKSKDIDNVFERSYDWTKLYGSLEKR